MLQPEHANKFSLADVKKDDLAKHRNTKSIHAMHSINGLGSGNTVETYVCSLTRAFFLPAIPVDNLACTFSESFMMELVGGRVGVMRSNPFRMTPSRLGLWIPTCTQYHVCTIMLPLNISAFASQHALESSGRCANSQW